MVVTEATWWPVIREVLQGEWGCEGQPLRADTPLFQDGAGTWMEWVELTQLVLDRQGKSWPPGLDLGHPRTGEELAALLQRAIGPAR